jgi:hypothetical protein
LKREGNERLIITAVREQVSCDLQGEAVILQLNAGVYYGLNEVGARVWALVQQPTAFGDIVRTLGDEYDVDPLRCADDLRTLIHEMSDAGLVRVEVEAAT